MNIKCKTCERPIHYRNQIGFIWANFGVFCVNCQRKGIKISKARYSVLEMTAQK